MIVIVIEPRMRQRNRVIVKVVVILAGWMTMSKVVQIHQVAQGQ